MRLAESTLAELAGELRTLPGTITRGAILIDDIEFEFEREEVDGLVHHVAIFGDGAS
jgi:hypothetical protein